MARPKYPLVCTTHCDTHQRIHLPKFSVDWLGNSIERKYKGTQAAGELPELYSAVSNSGSLENLPRRRGRQSLSFLKYHSTDGIRFWSLFPSLPLLRRACQLLPVQLPVLTRCWSPDPASGGLVEKKGTKTYSKAWESFR